MGEKTITTQVKIDGDIVPDFSFDWEVEFQGEKYIMPLRIPAGSKGNESLKSEISLTFQHWAIYQLKRWPFVTIQPIGAGTYLADEEEATVSLNLGDFCNLVGQVLEYYYGNAITIDLNPAWEYDEAPTVITISHTKIWNVLIDALHGKYGVRWEIKAGAANNNSTKGGERYVIRVGYPTTEVNHIFKYGFDGGLMKIDRQVQSEEIRNMLKGRGGETNIPRYYFKQVPEAEKERYFQDPDWVEELATVYFRNLMPATFRSYIQGWKAAHISKYPGYTAVGENNAYAPWAYRKGYTDTKFRPVEFVADEITVNPQAGDRQVEILPGYAPYVKKGSSLDKYGPLPDTLDNNDDFYPTIQGTGMDIAVAVEQVTSDTPGESAPPESSSQTLPGGSASALVRTQETKEFIIQGGVYAVPEGKRVNLDPGKITLSGKVYAEGTSIELEDHTDSLIMVGAVVWAYNSKGEKLAAVGLPEGGYRYETVIKVQNTFSGNLTTKVTLADITAVTSAASDAESRGTFNIWVQNIWDSTRLQGETDTQYAERVWKPVLGDREKQEAKIMFTSGALAHEDYEFTIIGYPVPDTSMTYQETDSKGNVIATLTSYWRIKLAKSDAEYQATGLYIPSTQKQGAAGDRIVFINSEMTHRYVVWNEIALDDWKKDQLEDKKEIKPTLVVTTDRVRLNGEGKSDALINQLRVGNSIRVADKRFIQPVEGSEYETLYLQSITYTYREPTKDDAALNPDVAIVLSNEYAVTGDPISMMQGDISALQRQVGSISNVGQIARAIGDQRYMRKDGVTERSASPTSFSREVTSDNYIGGENGIGWGLTKSGNGEALVETDNFAVRKEARMKNIQVDNQLILGDYVPGVSGGTFYIDSNGEAHIDTAYLTVNKKMTVKELEIQQQRWVGGSQISSPAGMVCGRVEPVYAEDGTGTVRAWRCFFRATDADGRKIHNEFRVNDLARCETFNLMRDSDGMLQNRYYWRRVEYVSEDANPVVDAAGDAWHQINLSNGQGRYDPASNCAPAPEDHIITLGNATDPSRQNAIVIASYGEGAPYIYQLTGIDSFTTAGKVKTRISPNGNRFTGEFRLEVGGEDKGDVGELLSSADGKITTLEATSDGIMGKVGKISRNLLRFREGMWQDPYQNWDMNEVPEKGALYCEQGATYPSDKDTVYFRCPVDQTLFKPDTDYILTFYARWQSPEDDEGTDMPASMVFWASIQSAEVSSVMAPQVTAQGEPYVWDTWIKQTFRLHTNKTWDPRGQMLQLRFFVGMGAPAWPDNLRFDMEEIKLEQGTFATPFVPGEQDIESVISQQADQIAMSIKVDGKERAGLTLDAEEGVTLQSDKVQIKNGDEIAALFTGGMLNANLINVGKLTTIVDGLKRITVSEFGDAFIRFYHHDGITVACKLGLEYVALETGGNLTPVPTAANAQALTDSSISGDISITTGKPAIIQVYNEAGDLTWVLFLDGPVTPDTQTYSWRTLSLVAPGSASQDLITTAATLKATEYWQFRVSGDKGKEPYLSQAGKVFTKKLADNEFTGAASYYVPNGRYYSPSVEIAPAAPGEAATWRRRYYQITNGIMGPAQYITVTP